MNKFSLPICIPFLKSQSTDVQNYAQLSLSLLQTLLRKHYPEQTESLQLAYSLLKTAPDIETLPELSQISPVSGITCRKIQNLLGCRTLCPACSYSAVWQNQHESQEAIILSYILQDFSNFACLCSYNITPHFFKALFYCQEEAGFFIFPLHKSLYQYMLKYYHLGTKRDELLGNYPAFLKQELEQKISIHSQQLIQTYIKNLIETGKKITLEDINAILQAIKKDSSAGSQRPYSVKKQNEAAPIKSLDYILSANHKLPDHFPSPGESPDQSFSPAPVKTVSQEKKSSSSVPDTKFQKISEFIMDLPEALPSVLSPQNQKLSSPSASILTDIHFSMDDLKGYAHFFITASSIFEEYELLENKLLTARFISIEGAFCDETKQDYILLYIDGCYFIISTDCQMAVHILAAVLNRPSSIQKFVSFDCYYTVWLLSAMRIIPEYLISIQQTFRFLHRDAAIECEKTPEQLVSLLENKYNHLNLSFYCFAMKYYSHMYRQLNPVSESDWQAYRTDQLFHQFLGASYYLPSADGKKERSFNLDGTGKLTFPSSPAYIPEFSFVCMSYIIRTEVSHTLDILSIFLKPALSALYCSPLRLKSGLQIVSIGKDKMQVCCKKAFQEKISECIHMLLSYYAVKNNIYIEVTEE